MKTPKEFTDNLKNGTITRDMLAVCLYSVNKRAKNYRDKESEYRSSIWGDKYDNESKCREKKKEYYSYKDKMLSLITPKCIHTVTRIFREKVYHGAYENIYDEDSYYYDEDYNDDDDYHIEEYEETEYFLFYELGNYSFHTPVKEDVVRNKYSSLQVNDIGNLTTYGHEINDLISVPFVRKVIALIDSGKYKFEGGSHYNN